MESKKLTPEIISLIKKPLPKEAIKQHPTKKYLSTIKAIYVVERLNECFGIGGWYVNNEFVERDKAWIVVKSTFHVPEYGIIVPDIFGGNDNADLGDAYKGACTDALTKIGSYLGIGMDVFKGLAEKPESKEEAKPVKKPILTFTHSKWDDSIAWLKQGHRIEDLRQHFEISSEVELEIKKLL